MLKGFKVISVYGNTSESTVTVTSKYFKFNADTAAELGYPKYIQMLIDADNKKFAIQATDEQGANSIEFKVSEPSESGKKSVINVAFKAAHATIVQLMQWGDGASRKMNGIFVPEEKAIMINCNFNDKEAQEHYGTARLGTRFYRKSFILFYNRILQFRKG